MRPLAQFPIETARHVRAVLTDIDDTLTDEGRLPALAYGALERLRNAGLLVIPVTGRPAGWCDLIARQWPVDGVVGENGAFWFRYDEQTHKMKRHFERSIEQRRQDQLKLDAIGKDVLSQVAGTALSADQGYRAVDLAIDFREDVPALSDDAVGTIVDIFERHGAIAKVSSIHVNGWFGRHDKLTTSLEMLRVEFGLDAKAERERIVFVGDSPNDAPMFDYFPNAVGVANVLRFGKAMPALPAFVTKERSADGFAELTDLLLSARA